MELIFLFQGGSAEFALAKNLFAYVLDRYFINNFSSIIFCNIDLFQDENTCKNV